ncbi:hypothetical protein OO006_07995 [Prosthecochloris sp. SCSIO W1101]|nr:hypothetical protein [Prosthecochloris sp. SCSIO W1101]UZJ40313.1 hypothetical protein OO006_07995 [Prosthecochloris sp. SCSIO W1101]
MSLFRPDFQAFTGTIDDRCRVESTFLISDFSGIYPGNGKYIFNKRRKSPAFLVNNPEKLTYCLMIQLISVPKQGRGKSKN